MARNVTRQQLREQLDEMTDTVNDQHLSDEEKNRIINRAITDFWDLVTSSGLAEKYVKKVSFTTVPGQQEYAFEDIAVDGDFYRIHQVYVDEGNGQLRSISRISPAETLSFRPVQSAVPMWLYYIKCTPELDPGDLEGTGADGEPIDGINGWEEYILNRAAWYVKVKKEDSTAPFLQRANELAARIKSMGNIDFGEPARVVKRRRTRVDPWLLYSNNVNCYMVRGDKLELFYNHGYVP